MTTEEDKIENEYWEKIEREAPVHAVAKCEEAAKQLITVNSLISAIYIGIITASDLLQQPPKVRPFLLILLIPLGLWISSIGCAIDVVIPRNRPVDDFKTTYINVGDEKERKLRTSYLLSIISISMILFILVGYLLYLPQPQSINIYTFLIQVINK